MTNYSTSWSSISAIRLCSHCRAVPSVSVVRMVYVKSAGPFSSSSFEKRVRVECGMCSVCT